MTGNPTILVSRSMDSAGTPAIPAEPAGFLRHFGFWALAFYLFLMFGRVNELLLILFGAYPPVTAITALVAVLAALTALAPAIVSRVGTCLTALTFWLMLATPFSVWRGGSFRTLTEKWFKSYAGFLIVATLISSPRQLRQAFRVVAFSSGILVLAALALSVETLGRAALDSGSLKNPNVLAATLCVAVPFMAFFTLPGNSALTRAGWSLSIVAVFLIALKTGSRQGSVMCVILFLCAFFGVSLAGKVKMVVVAVLLCAIAVSTLPKATLMRLATIVGSGENVAAQQIEAVESKQTRLELLLISLRTTARHPLLGVGPGVFGDFVYREFLAAGVVHRASETHNTYTQLSSEAGIPALLLYTYALVFCLTRTRSLRRACSAVPEGRELAGMARCLSASLITFAVGALFGSNAYDFTFPALAGFVVALDRTASRFLAFAGVSPGSPRQSMPEPLYRPA